MRHSNINCENPAFFLHETSQNGRSLGGDQQLAPLGARDLYLDRHSRQVSAISPSKSVTSYLANTASSAVSVNVAGLQTLEANHVSDVYVEK